MLRRLTAVIEREGDGYVALCPQLDIASQGDTIEEARTNLTEALTLFFETADASEIDRRFQPDVFITQVEVPVGWAPDSLWRRAVPYPGGPRISASPSTW